jgi:hypothetical protein
MSESTQKLHVIASLLRQAAELIDQVANDGKPRRRSKRTAPPSAGKAEETVRQIQRSLRRNGVVDEKKAS